MRKLLTVFAVLVALIIMVILGGFIYLNYMLPDVSPAPDLSIEGTPQQIERGAYLANHVAVCIDCHSQRDWTRFSGPIKKGTEGQGGEVFDEGMGLPGTFYAKNITPAAVGDWTDGELYRLITTGVTKDGEALFPIMPYKEYAQLDPRDVKAIIAYVRTLEPIEHETPESQANFPMNLIMNTIPSDTEPGVRPPQSDTVQYGRYLTQVAGCVYCHTPQEKGKPIKAMTLAGGFEFGMPGGGVVRSMNITPHKETGIGYWTAEVFIERFKSYQDAAELAKVGPNDFNTFMPWNMYAGMKESDLRAIFRYLETVEPVDHSVERFTAEK